MPAVSSPLVVSSLQEQRRLGAGSRAVGLVQAQHLRAQPSPARRPVSGELFFTTRRKDKPDAVSFPASRQLSASRLQATSPSPGYLGTFAQRAHVFAHHLHCEGAFYLPAAQAGTVQRLAPDSELLMSVSRKQIAVFTLQSSPVVCKINEALSQVGLAQGPFDCSAPLILSWSDAGLFLLEATGLAAPVLLSARGRMLVGVTQLDAGVSVAAAIPTFPLWSPGGWWMVPSMWFISGHPKKIRWVMRESDFLSVHWKRRLRALLIHHQHLIVVY